MDETPCVKYHQASPDPRRKIKISVRNATMRLDIASLRNIIEGILIVIPTIAMQKGLSLLLDRFRLARTAGGDTIPPLLVSLSTAFDIVEYFSGTKIESVSVLKSEFLPNIFVFTPDEEGDSFKIKLAREMSEKAHIRSSDGYKVFIALGIQDLTLEAANSLLKVLEDIPSDTLFVLVSEAPKELLPDTILSRVIAIDSGLMKYKLDDKIQVALDDFLGGNKSALTTALYGFFKKKRENARADTLAILEYLLSHARSGVFSSEEISVLESAFLRAASTNATAKWVLDAAILALK